MKPTRRARTTAKGEPELPDLAKLADAPLASPLGHFIPGGKRRRGPKAKAEQPVQEQLFANLPAKPKLPRKTKEAVDRLQKIAAMLDHYSRTSVPLAEVAAHCLLTPERAREELAKRGRNDV